MLHFATIACHTARYATGCAQVLGWSRDTKAVRGLCLELADAYSEVLHLQVCVCVCVCVCVYVCGYVYVCSTHICLNTEPACLRARARVCVCVCGYVSVCALRASV